MAAHLATTARASRSRVKINDYLGGFGIFHDTAAQSRIMKWDSAA